MRCVLVEIGRPRRAHAQPLDGFTMPRRRHRVEMRSGRANISKEWPARRLRIACDVGKPRDRSIAVLCVRVRSTVRRSGQRKSRRDVVVILLVHPIRSVITAARIAFGLDMRKARDEL